MTVSHSRTRIYCWGQKKELCLAISFVSAVLLVMSNTRLSPTVIKTLHCAANSEKSDDDKDVVPKELITLSFMLNKLQV